MGTLCVAIQAVVAGATARIVAAGILEGNESVKVFGNSGFSCKLVFGLLFMAHFQTLPFMMLKVNQIIIPFCAFTKKYSSIEKTLSFISF